MNAQDTIILLDDDPGTVEVVRTSLSILRPQWQILEAADAEEAVTLLEKHPVSALVTDWMMPGKDGIEVTRMVRELEERTGCMRFVVILTARRTESRLQAIQIANEFLPKPPDPRELEALLTQGLRTTRRANELLQNLETAALLARTDPLTGASNRRNGMQLLTQEIERWRRTSDSLSVLLVDLDHFKQVNDTHGHETGDEVLVATAQRLQDHLRPFDSLVRWGGEEFLVILPHTGPREGKAVAERLCQAQRMPIPTGGSPVIVTTSIGVASVRNGLDDVALLVSEADKAMYQAKTSGRDRVVVDPESTLFVPDPDALREDIASRLPPRTGVPVLLGLVASTLLGSGCRLAEPVDLPAAPTATSTAELQVPQDFAFDAMPTVPLEVRVDYPDGSPYPEARTCLLTARSDLVECGSTDALGRIAFRAARQPDGFRLFVAAVGVPLDTIAIGPEVRSVTIPQEPTAPIAAEAPLMAGRAATWSVPSTGSSDLPSGLDTRNRSLVTNSLLSDVNFAFPESRPVPIWHPEYLEATNAEEILLEDSAEVRITFLHEGAGYRNSFGVYVIPPGGQLSSARTLDKRIVFPNASLRNSGGNLVAGDRISLGNFARGTRIGFLLIPNGWTGSRVDTLGKPVYYSRSSLNPEPSADQRRHVAILWHEASRRAILGFEDLDRSSSGCDNDFNDILFTVDWNPFEAVDEGGLARLPGRTDSDGDGASDNVDDFPDDPSRAYEKWFPSREGWGTVAFEDLWPSRGDFDYNDFVARYQVREVRDAAYRTKDVEFKLLAVAAGAEIRNGLSLGLGSLPTRPESSWVRVRARQRDHVALRDDATGATVIRLWNDNFTLFAGSEGGMINTVPGRPRLLADTLVARVVLATAADLPDPPYDLFLFRSADSAHEIHLVDKAPSPWMRRTLLGTRDDRSDWRTSTWYRTSNRLPWGLHLSGDWQPPREGVDFLLAYPAFADWVVSGGRSSLDWAARVGDPALVSPP